jgi:type III secretion protein V
MNRIYAALEALPRPALGRSADGIVAVVAAAMLTMLIVPLPPALLDVLLATNLALAALILAAALLAPRPLALSSFPTLLLLTTLFRLALNVSTARLILSRGSAGDVVAAFGAFVLKGDPVVGVVVFLVLTLVQFMVIGKGAERIAEVAARFSLDAMPGKQMSIDAAVRSGVIDETEAEARRDELCRESRFQGAMDGAMKFVKGDAVAGLVITALNLCVGLALGVVRDGLELVAAAERYALLTVGDGLVAQIPALAITLAAAVLATRVESRDVGASLGSTLRSELFGDAGVMAVAAGFVLCLGLLPGLPFGPFAVLAMTLGIAARRMARLREHTGAFAQQQQAENEQRRSEVQRQRLEQLPAAVPMLGIDLDPELSLALGFDEPGETTPELIGQLIPELRESLFLETGVRFPGVRVRSGVLGLEPGTVVFRVKDVPVARERIEPGMVLAVEAPGRLLRLGLRGEPCRHPLSGGEATLVPADWEPVLQASGVTAWRTAGIVTLHLARVMRRHAALCLGLQETTELLENIERLYPALVKEAVPKAVSLHQLAEVLRRLVDEGVSIRDLRSILEALVEHARYESDGVALTEHVRAALAQQLAHQYAGLGGRLSVMLLDTVMEDTIRSAIVQTQGGSYLALEPELRRSFAGRIARALGPVAAAGVRPVILTVVDVRRYVRKLVEEELGEVAVLSFQELPADLTIQPLGRIGLDEPRGLAA